MVLKFSFLQLVLLTPSPSLYLMDGVVIKMLSGIRRACWKRGVTEQRTGDGVEFYWIKNEGWKLATDFTYLFPILNWGLFSYAVQ